MCRSPAQHVVDQQRPVGPDKEMMKTRYDGGGYKTLDSLSPVRVEEGEQEKGGAIPLSANM